jgi:hypothetical protein
MEKKRKSRYLLAIYLVVAGLAVIIALVAINYCEGNLQSILLNLSTELLGVVLIFFLVNRLFLLEEWNVSERIDELIAAFKSSRQPSAIAFFQKQPSIEPHVQRASRIDLCGVTLTSTINRQRSNLRDSLREGAQIRILVSNPDSSALQMSALRSETINVDYYRRRLEEAFEHLQYLHRHWLNQQQADSESRGGSLTVRLLSYAPSFGIMSFDANRPVGTMFVELYPHHTGFGSPPAFELTLQKDRDWYTYFADQFEAMWEAATPWKPSVDAVQEPTVTKPEVMFQDRTFDSWQQYRNGKVSQSQEQVHRGTYSLKKHHASNPHGGFKEMDNPIGLGVIFSGWIYRPTQRGGGQADRLAVEDSNFNGYGFAVDHLKNVVYIERRKDGTHNRLGSGVKVDPPMDQWYRFEFYMKRGGQFELRLYNHSGDELVTVPDVPDQAYSSFDRVVVHGGCPYYIDDLRIEAL